MALTTISGTGTQASTSTPQSAGGGTTGGTPSGSVQPGTAASSLVSSQGGVPLRGQALSVVNLAPATATATVQAAPKPTAQKHQINGPLFGFSLFLFAIACLMFWLTSRTAKTTT